jgi:hypothetical protein
MESTLHVCSGARILGAVILLCLMAVAPARADQWSLILNGKAIHIDPPANAHYNEDNWGAGIHYEFASADAKWVPFLTASGFIDSNKNPSYYAGGGYLRRYMLSDGAAGWHVDAGAVLFLMTREEFNGGHPFPGILPVVSVGTSRVAVNLTFIPKVDPKMVPLLFFQLKLGLGR